MCFHLSGRKNCGVFNLSTKRFRYLCRRPLERQHVVASAVDERAPGFHDRPPTGDQARPGVGVLGVAADLVGDAALGELAIDARLAAPIAEGGAKPMRRSQAPAARFINACRLALRIGLPASLASTPRTADEHKSAVGLLGLHAAQEGDRRRAERHVVIAGASSMRAAGIVQTPASRSISDQLSRRAPLVRSNGGQHGCPQANQRARLASDCAKRWKNSGASRRVRRRDALPGRSRSATDV